MNLRRFLKVSIALLATATPTVFSIFKPRQCKTQSYPFDPRRNVHIMHADPNSVIKVKGGSGWCSKAASNIKAGDIFVSLGGAVLAADDAQILDYGVKIVGESLDPYIFTNHAIEEARIWHV